jgi:hypothetical protein
VAFALWVRYSFVPNQLAAEFDRPFPILRDRTMGREVGVLFALLPLHARRADVVVFIIGDSTVHSGNPDPAELPFLVRSELERILPERRIELVDLSMLGLYASDGLVFTAEALSVHPDLVVYSMSPRVIPAAPERAWTTNVSELALRWEVASRIGARGLIDLLEPSAIGRTVAHSYYPPLAVRIPIATAFWDWLFARLPARLAPLQAAVAPGPPPSPPLPLQPLAAYQWRRADYPVDSSNRNLRALDRLVALCGRERHCLLYHGPFNPASRTTGFEPPLDDEFVEHLSREADRASVPFVDYRPLGTPERFKTTLVGTPDAIHLNPDGKRWFAPILARDIATHLPGSHR